MECTNDEWRMFYYKVMPCRKHYSHDWSDCPYSHDGEKAQRRCPRTHQYTGLSCPDMKKNGECPRGDKCHFSHNSFEYWLHPSRYRSQFCTFGTSCRRPVCFFAHTVEELRMPNTPTSRINRPAPLGLTPYLDGQDSSSSDFLLSSGSSSPVNDAIQMPGSFSPQHQMLVGISGMPPNAHLQQQVMSPLTLEGLSGSELGTPPHLSSSYMFSSSPESTYSFLPEQQGLQYLMPEPASLGFDEFMAAAEQQVNQRIQQQQQQQQVQQMQQQQAQQQQAQQHLQPYGSSQATRLPHPASASILRTAATSNQGLLLRRQAASMKAARPAYCAGDMLAMQELYGSSAWPLQAA